MYISVVWWFDAQRVAYEEDNHIIVEPIAAIFLGTRSCFYLCWRRKRAGRRGGWDFFRAVMKTVKRANGRGTGRR
jgi:hypothetical protein